MLADAELVAFVATTDPDRARRFYGETLGLPLVERTDYACVFAAGAAVLRVTVVERVAAAPYTVLGWTVPDLAAAVRRLAAAGVDCLRYPGLGQDDLGIWSAPGGALVAWLRDGDDNILSLTQPAAGPLGTAGSPPAGENSPAD